ncbi:MAG: DUF4159 domain-containing protein [Rhodobacteraceae bacterium]|jgi:hypothetical protein|nr:DUF4159 domain-containing protein [Paracoccaceae bacterium]
MLVLGPVGFTAPALLLGLAVLPVLWFLLRAVPPAPVRRRFPGVALLLGLKDETAEADRTPWWLLLLRMAAAALLILGFAGPVLNPEPRAAAGGPLLVIADGTWADAADWPRRQERITALLDEAGRNGRPVAVVVLTDPPAGPLPFQAAGSWAERVAGLEPRPFAPDPDALAALSARLPETGFETVWLSDGLARDSRAPLLAALEAHGPVRVVESPRPVLALAPAAFREGAIALAVLRPAAGPEAGVTVSAHGLDPAGIARELARLGLVFAAGATTAEAALALPPELRNRILSFQIAGIRSAGAVSLTDDALRRRKVALIAGREDREGLDLLSPLHYLRNALAPVAELIDGPLEDVLHAAPDVIVLADVARLTEAEAATMLAWVERGGLLVRFAGPRLAASDVARTAENPLMPVRLREGGRTLGGAMSWGEPKRLRPFPDGSPFAGLPIPEDVQVAAQVLAQPDPSLAERTIASLADGTPLVTRRLAGQGQVVLFHVTANAEWSTLPLSGLFVQMLERLAVSTRPAAPAAEDLEGTVWVAEKRLDAFGRVGEAGQIAGVAGSALAGAIAAGAPSAAVPPGVYAAGDRRVALNVIGYGTVLAPAVWPAWIPVEGLAPAAERPLKGEVLAGALALLLLDILVALWISGRLGGPRATSAAVALAALLVATEARADDSAAIRATGQFALAHVLSGDPEVDRMAAAGLAGLTRRLFERTSVEPAEPIAVDIETDELAFFPFLYWPVTADQPLPSDAAYARLNHFLRTGGLILFDTRDADIAPSGGTTAAGRRLREIARPLDVPALEPVPTDHVLTRTFYLIQEFPGRFAGREVWVEAAAPDAERAEGMPFRNLNDGVTPVVIGGNDWAAAWALDPRGGPMVPVGRGLGGERQRELAVRFGVNLVMHVLTGNYKSDQVHVPALLERLGQ